MATYVELRSLVSYAPLRHGIEVAIVDVAVDIFDEGTPVDSRREWASAALDSPPTLARRLIYYVLVLNQSSSVEDIKAAAFNKATLKANINTAVDKTVAAAA